MLKYYQDITIYNLGFSILIGLYAGMIWSLIIFCSVGLLIGIIFFETFRKNQYFFYYNMGFTKKQLIFNTWLINIGIAIPLLLIIIIIKWLFLK